MNETNSTMMTDEDWMARAAALALRGEGAVNPNPLVGAVVVKNGVLIGEGWHERWGGLHAERNALACCTESPRGATVYVTLEPCCHYGKTPPCTEALIEAGVARVVVGLDDPNPLVAGKGFAALRAAGIEVTTGVMTDVLKYHNRVFLKYICQHRPWVVLKSAMTLDGKIATRTGHSRWVTGSEARQRVHMMRRRYMAILVGIGTALADDPLLNCRLEAHPEARQPIRFVVDSRAQLPLQSQQVATARELRTVVAHTDAAPAERLEALRAAGVETWLCPAVDDHVDLDALMQQIGAAGIDSVLVESGGTLAEAFLRRHLVDEVVCFIAPKIVGGRDAKTPVEGLGAATMDDAVILHDIRTEQVGEDVMITALV
jgi:diaminohydroxyphosphoribosylaminopyrimidine deaminase/5-amino-6-(5-phosphoribosylamino)uracil reductase